MSAQTALTLPCGGLSAVSHVSPSPPVTAQNILMLGWPGPSLPCPCQAQGAGAALQGAVLLGGPQSHPKAHLLFLSHSVGGEGGARRALQGPEHTHIRLLGLGQDPGPLWVRDQL